MIKYETDSRKVKEGQIFVAITGNTVDGHDYIEQAISNGAVKVVGTKDLNLDVPYEKVNNSEEYLKEHLYNEYHGIIDELDFIGVTGTNGKTTTCYLTYQILNKLGYEAAYMGTIGFFFKDTNIVLNNTTPDMLTLYKLLIEAHDNGCKVVVMEVSSHSLDMERIYGIKYKVAGFTNLTQDHLDYHKTMDNYFNAKVKLLNHLFDSASFITNGDDEYGIKFNKLYHNTFSYGKNNCNYNIINEDITPSNTSISFTYENNVYNVTTNLTSEFNVYNYILSLALVNKYGARIDDIINVTKDIMPPKGRCETYKVKNGYAVIDYAHTPDAVEKIITAYNKLKKGKLYTIVGCGGDRDKTKRPIMGDIASRLSDYVIFTSDNPRTENPHDILNDILAGVKTSNYEVIIDRKEAIKCGLDKLNNDDILLLLGKGHEDYQIIGHDKIHLDDSEEVLNYVKDNK